MIKIMVNIKIKINIYITLLHVFGSVSCIFVRNCMICKIELYKYKHDKYINRGQYIIGC